MPVAGKSRELKLVRLPQYAGATPGILHVDGAPTFPTLELPWLDNARRVSCIPVGKYQLRRINSPTFGQAFEVADVPNRSEILIHPGNTVEDIQGCILVGEYFGFLPPLFAVRDSRRAFKRFMALMDGVAESTLEVV